MSLPPSQPSWTQWNQSTQICSMKWRARSRRAAGLVVDRDLILAGLIVAGASVTLLAAGQWPAALDVRASARAGEREVWRSLWWPFALALVVACVFIGWALMEPAQSDEHLPSAVAGPA